MLEDANYYCVDNLPPGLLPQLVEALVSDNQKAVAVATDTRSAAGLEFLPQTIAMLRNEGHHVRVLFLTASTESLVARFSETRRSHPLSRRLNLDLSETPTRTLTECLDEEREILGPIQGMAHVIDTTDLRANQLRAWVKDFIGIPNIPLVLMFESFAFKRGVPLDADLVFDVRMLPNPHYDIAMRDLTGRDQPVIDFLENQNMAQEMYQDILRFLEKWIPSFKKDNRSYLTVAIGCTGGQHRSVFMVEKLARHFALQEDVLVRHRRLQ